MPSLSSFTIQTLFLLNVALQLLLVTSSQVLAGDVYRWRDAKGTLDFDDYGFIVFPLGRSISPRTPNGLELVQIQGLRAQQLRCVAGMSGWQVAMRQTEETRTVQSLACPWHPERSPPSPASAAENG